MGNEFSAEIMALLEDLAAGAPVISVISTGFSNLVSLAVYIFTALALYNIAKRRGIANPWLAWVPFTQFWTLASISDDYQMKAHNRKKNKRVAMLVIMIVVLAMAIALAVFCVAMVVSSIASGEALESMEDLGAMAGIVAIVVVLTLVLVALVIALTVLQYMALYDVYRSCDPDNAVVFILLTVFFSITQPIFLMLAQNKDRGMPRPAPQVTDYQPIENIEHPF